MVIPIKLTCDVVDMTKVFQQMQGPTATLSADVETLIETARQFIVLWKEVANNGLHLHAKHYHTVSNNSIHDVLEKAITSKACVMSTSKGNIDTLSSEQNSFTDFTQTGMIFGRDYGFKYNLNLPRYYKMLHDPESNPHYHTMIQDLRDFQDFIDIVMNDLYMNDDETCGHDYSSASMSTILITEFFKEKDLDDDGLIYGEDFIIEDENAPEELLQINIINNIKIDNPEIAVKTWDEYLESIEQKESVMDMVQITPFTFNELVDELITEFTTCTDVNGDTLIYGKDFLIIGDDEPVKLNQYVPLYLPDIIMTWTSYCKSREYKTETNKQKYIDLLLSEYEQNIDLDGNGFIYGIDFIITNREYFDSESLDLISDINILNQMTLSEYNNSIKPYYENYVLNENIFAAKYNAEWLDGVDVDNNGLRYSYDFILTDFEENKTECLWTIERYRNYTLKWTSDKINNLGLDHMISDYTQTEFNLYWECASIDSGNVDEEQDHIEVNYTCPSDNKLLVPLDINGIDLSEHIILFDGNYWYDLGFSLTHSGLYITPIGDNINLTGISINFTFDVFSDASIYYIKNKSNITPETSYVFKINYDSRFRIYKSNRFFSIVDECLDLDDNMVSIIESSTESKNFIIVSDTRLNKSEPIDNSDLTGFMIRWVYNDENESGNWILYNYYKTHLNRIILIDNEDLYKECYVPLYKQQDNFKFLPYVLNVTWNDIT